jgi:pimeloyl-ACP methyl ester carboxylesterase
VPSPTFVLVHGAWHDGRAWDLLVDALARRGSAAVAVDLPSDEVGVDDSGWAAVIADAARDAGPEPAVLVGHSLAGIAIPLVPALTPVRRLVYLAALLPDPGRPILEIMAEEKPLAATDGLARDELGRSYWASPEAAIATLYQDCDPSLAREAAARLRPQARTAQEAPCPLSAYPAVPASAIVMRDDRMVRPEWSRAAIPARLGIEPLELPGGHSPMLADPERLAATLLELDAA